MPELKNLEAELYSDEGVCNIRPDIVAKVAENYGVVPCYHKYKDVIPEEKITYLNPSDEYVLGKYLKPAMRAVREYYGKNTDVAPWPKNLKVSIEKLPSYYILRKEKGSKRAKLLPVGKIFGLYEPEKKVIKYDPIIFGELNDPERKYWSKLGISDKIHKPEEVVPHEYLHYGQDRLGVIQRASEKFGPNLGRIYIEGQTTALIEEIRGVPPQAYKEYRDLYKGIEAKVGKKEALLLDFNPCKVLPGYCSQATAC